MKASPAKTSFNAGEISPLLHGRPDVAKVANGCVQLRNFIPLVQGPVRRRMGTRYLGPVKDGTRRTWLSKFEFNTAQAYVLEWSQYSLRFWTDEGQLLDGSTGQPIEVVTPYSEADLTSEDNTFALDMVQSGDVLYVVHPSHPPQKLARYGNTDWRFGPVVFASGPFKSQNTEKGFKVYTSGTTGTVTLTATKEMFTPKMVEQLVRLEPQTAGITAWTSGQQIAKGGENPYGLKRRSSGKTYVCADNFTVASGRVVQTGGDTPLHTMGTLRDGSGQAIEGTTAQMQGVQWAFKDFGWGYVKITAIASPVQALATVVDNPLPDEVVGAGNATYRWSLGAFNRVDGYPQAVTFFRERLAFAAGQRLYFSAAGDFENFVAVDQSGNVTAAQAVQAQIASDQVNDVQWLAPQQGLIIGTAGAEFVCMEQTLQQPFGAGNVKIEQHSFDGARKVKPERVGSATLFVQRSGKKLKELTLDVRGGSYKSADLTVLAEHLTNKGTLQQVAWHREPYLCLWAVRSDGALLGFTYDTAQDVTGWHEHSLGPDINGVPHQMLKVESLAVIPSMDRTADQLWMVVRFGESERWMLMMEQEGSGRYVDAGLAYKGSATHFLGGLGYLELLRWRNLAGLDPNWLGVLADGAVPHYDFLRESDAVQINRDATSVSVGLNYPSILCPTLFEAGAGDGTTQSKYRRTNRMGVRFHETQGGEWHGTGFKGWSRFLFPQTSVGEAPSALQMGAAPVKFTGLVTLEWEGAYTLEDNIYIRQGDPFPITVSGLYPQQTVYDR